MLKRHLPLPFVLLMLAAAVCPCTAEEQALPPQVANILGRKCVRCHGAGKVEAELSLTTRAEAINGGEGGPAIVPGKPDESLLVEMISGEKPAMPSEGDPLSAEEVQAIRRWIAAGAPWPSDRTLVAKAAADESWWALQPIRELKVPEIKSDLIRTPIDAFILAKLHEKGLAPASAADPRTLLRRLKFDLVGLPPTAEEVDDFVKESSPTAYEQLIDKLLASPDYGERWARHWLDVVRFSESQGFEYDRLREHAWRYRDYVINAFNRDKPYGDFIREQIAGDLLLPLTREGITATSFLVIGPWDEAGHRAQKSVIMKTRLREEELEETIGTIGQTFLGLTTNCARCHDHKFDPISQRDYYRLKACLAGVQFSGESRSILTPFESHRRENRVARIQKEMDACNAELAELERVGRQEVVRRRQAEKSSVASAGDLPRPYAQWTFDSDASDVQGRLHGTLEGGATIAGGRLQLSGKKASLKTAPLDKSIRAKTLEAWVSLANLTQRGGGVVSLETNGGQTFDAIVFGEIQEGKWIAGSNNFVRTSRVVGAKESSKPDELVHVAVTYADDGAISIYRNGQPYAAPYRPTGVLGELPTFGAGEARVLLGQRHTGGGNAFLTGEIDEARLYDRALTSEEVAASYRASSTTITRDDIAAALTEEKRARHGALLKELSDHRRAMEAIEPVPLAYASMPGKPEPTHVLARGDVEKLGEPVSAGALAAIHTPSGEFGLPLDASDAERRVKLAEWLADPVNPLTARVIVNRVWHYHFGRGIVGTPNDFGYNGERPSHPELLDWLAARFIAEGRSLKKLHRLILLSGAYRQSSTFNTKAGAVDADNRLLWRFSPRRLESEAIHDAMLSVSGKLDPARGGPSDRPTSDEVVHPQITKRSNPNDDGRRRRSIYRMVINSAKDPLEDALDCPDPSIKTPKRSVTTTPLQALSLMNNAFVLRTAGYFAERVKTEAGGDPSKQITLAYQLAFGRPPSEVELKRAVAHVRDHGLGNFCWVLLNASEFLYVR
jgi:mono/diheme cytochrome c family protein